MSQVYRVSGGVMLRHRITLDFWVVIVLDEGYHKFCVGSTGYYKLYVLVTLRGRDRVVSRVVRITAAGVVLSRATQVAYGRCKCNGVLTLGVSLVV